MIRIAHVWMIATGLLIATGYADQQVSGTNENVLSSIQEFQRFVNNQNGSPRPYQLDGRLIWKNGDFFRVQFGNAVKSFQLQNGDGGEDSLATLSRSNVGDLVRICGIAHQGTVVNAMTVTLCERGSVGDLKVVPAFRVNSPVYWKYVGFSGIVREVYRSSGVAKLLVKVGTRKMVVVVDDYVPTQVSSKWLGSMVHIQGSSWKTTTKHSVPLIVGVMSCDQQIRIEESASAEFVQNVRDGYQSSTDDLASRFHTVRGSVDKVNHDSVIVNGLRLTTSLSHGLQYGDKIRALVCDYDPQSRTARIRETKRLGAHKNPKPQRISTAKILEDHMLYHRVTVHGFIENSFTSADGIELLLNDDGHTYQVKLPLLKNKRSPVSQYMRDALIRVTGVVSEIDESSDESLVIDVISRDDISVAQIPLHVDAKQAKWITGAVLFAVLLIVTWHYTLKRNVRLKTLELNETNSRMSAASGAVRDGILMFDSDGKISFLNDNLTQIFDSQFEHCEEQGVALQAIANRFADSKAFQCFAETAVANPDDVLVDEFRLSDRNAWLFVYTAPVLDEVREAQGRIWTFDDVTQRKRLEEESLQTRKINAVGRLAGGIAHDFNNLLQVIGSNLSLMEFEAQSRDQHQIRPSHNGASPYRDAHSAVERAAELTRQLLTFSRRSTIAAVPTNPNRVVQQTVNLLERTIGDHIRLSVSFEPDIHAAVIDSGQIEQVLLNMCLNSRDAIGVNDGYIRMTTRNGSHPQVGDCVVITVEDDGCGMSHEVLEQIFDPFFTTKPMDKGTGLGLATAFGAIEQMNGRIQCNSTVGEGTRFEIFLPATEEVASQLVLGPQTESMINGPSRRILLIDDDHQVLRGTERLLVKLGQRVVTASGGEEALAILANDQSFDLVLLDLSMPGMTGRETLLHLRDLDADLKVVVCSGYSDDAMAMLDSEAPPDAFLSKPFGLDQLSDVIQAV